MSTLVVPPLPQFYGPPPAASAVPVYSSDRSAVRRALASTFQLTMTGMIH